MVPTTVQQVHQDLRLPGGNFFQGTLASLGTEVGQSTEGVARVSGDFVFIVFHVSSSRGSESYRMKKAKVLPKQNRRRCVENNAALCLIQ
jgi:hypothetical protein